MLEKNSEKSYFSESKHKYPKGVDDELEKGIYDLGFVEGQILGLKKGQKIADEVFKKMGKSLKTKKR